MIFDPLDLLTGAVCSRFVFFAVVILFIVHIENLYCFQYTSSNEELPKATGWDFFSLETEFKRQHVPNDRWTLCNLNKNYELCDTCKSSE